MKALIGVFLILAVIAAAFFMWIWPQRPAAQVDYLPGIAGSSASGETASGWGGLAITFGIIALVVIIKLKTRSEDAEFERRRRQDWQQADVVNIHNLSDRNETRKFLQQAHELQAHNTGRVSFDHRRVVAVDGSPSDLRRMDFDAQAAAYEIMRTAHKSDLHVRFTKDGDHSRMAVRGGDPIDYSTPSRRRKNEGWW